jgi:dTDP-4-dehydrorhamnose reductase
MRVLVTGASGQVGSEVVREMSQRATIIAHDRRTLDLAHPEQIAGRVREARPDVIVNCAAYTAVDRAETEVELAHQVNGIAPAVLAEEAKAVGAALIHFSTDYVFDGSKPDAYVEGDPPSPVNAYGATKLEGERAIAAAGGAFAILRTSWVYGPHGANFMLTMLRLAASRDELRVVDDQRGAPTSSRQLARVVKALLDGDDALDKLREGAGVYHATAAGSTTWCAFARAIFEAVARKDPAFRAPRVIPIATREYPTPARRPANSVLSCEKLAERFGIRIPPWHAGLEEAVSGLRG